MQPSPQEVIERNKKIVKLYEEEDKTIQEIAEMYQVTASSIRYVLIKNGIEPHSMRHSKTEQRHKRIRELIEQGYTPKEVAVLENMNVVTVYKIIERGKTEEEKRRAREEALLQDVEPVADAEISTKELTPRERVLSEIRLNPEYRQAAKEKIAEQCRQGKWKPVTVFIKEFMDVHEERIALEFIQVAKQNGTMPHGIQEKMNGWEKNAQDYIMQKKVRRILNKGGMSEFQRFIFNKMVNGEIEEAKQMVEIGIIDNKEKIKLKQSLIELRKQLDVKQSPTIEEERE